MDNWIDVKDRLPKKTDKYLVYHTEYLLEIATYNKDENRWYANKMYRPVTHWQPLPPPPNNGAKP